VYTVYLKTGRIIQYSILRRDYVAIRKTYRYDNIIVLTIKIMIMIILFNYVLCKLNIILWSTRSVSITVPPRLCPATCGPSCASRFWRARRWWPRSDPIPRRRRRRRNARALALCPPPPTHRSGRAPSSCRPRDERTADGGGRRDENKNKQ